MQLSKGDKQMKFSKLSMIAGFIIAFALIFELTAHADEENQMTKISFSEAVQVPGTVLPAGTYQFVVARNESNQNIVQIFNAAGTKLYATVQTVPAERG
jgi:formate/nitrite transporter FocA (FNT family)